MTFRIAQFILKKKTITPHNLDATNVKDAFELYNKNSSGVEEEKTIN